MVKGNEPLQVLTPFASTACRLVCVSAREIPAAGGKLVVPFNEHPVYITSDTLDVLEMRKRIAEAKIENVTPLNLYALSLMKSANEAQPLSVRVENQMNREVKGPFEFHEDDVKG